MYTRSDSRLSVSKVHYSLLVDFMSDVFVESHKSVIFGFKTQDKTSFILG